MPLKWSTLLCPMAVGLLFIRAADAAPNSVPDAPPGLTVRLVVPLSAKGSRATLQLAIRNTGKKTLGINRPFMDNTRLWGISPSGKKRDFGGWYEGIVPASLAPGAKASWTMDLLKDTNRIGLPEPVFGESGLYEVYVSVNDVASNSVFYLK